MESPPPTLLTSPMPPTRTTTSRARRPRPPAPLQRLAKLLSGAPRQVTQQQLKQARPERFFARVRCFDMACPRCGQIVSTSPHSDPQGRPLDRQPIARGWNPIRCRLTCAACGLRLIIGLIAWVLPEHTRSASQTAPDTSPSPEQALELRDEWRAWGAEAHGMLVRTERAAGGPLTGGGKAFGNVVVAVEARISGEPAGPADESDT